MAGDLLPEMTTPLQLLIEVLKDEAYTDQDPCNTKPTHNDRNESTHIDWLYLPEPNTKDPLDHPPHFPWPIYTL
jgi:hypothetical protein